MELWQEFDDYMIYNESEKRVITWSTYGDVEYFLSQEYYYEKDFLEEPRCDVRTLVNEKITKENTLESLIKKPRT